MKLFVSYSEDDSALIFDSIVPRLEKNNEVWTNKKIDVGENWEQAIYNAIDSSEGIVFLMSPDSIKSEMCLKEIRYALEKNKIIFPVKVRRNTDMPLELGKRQYIDFSAGIDEDKILQLLGSISNAELRKYKKQK